MKNAEDEAFDEIAKKQGAWGGGFPAKRQMAADKLQEPVLDLDGHVVRDVRKPKKEALAQPAQEPVAYVMGTHGGRFVVAPLNPAMVLPTGMALYSTPQHTATWVGLTDEEIAEIRLKSFDSIATNRKVYEAIEAKLKEKNT